MDHIKVVLRSDDTAFACDSKPMGALLEIDIHTKSREIADGEFPTCCQVPRVVFVGSNQQKSFDYVFL